MAAALGMLGGLSGALSTISTIASVVGTVSSMFGSKGPEAPPPIVLPPAAPIPQPEPNRATLANADTQVQSREDYLRRTRLQEKQLTALRQKTAAEGESETSKPTLLGS